MARPALLASPVRGDLGPTGVGRIADLLALADDGRPTVDLVLPLVDRLYNAFEPRFAACLLIAGPSDGPYELSHQPPLGGSLAAGIRPLLDRIQTAAIADDGGSRLVAAPSFLNALETVPIVETCLSSVDPLEDGFAVMVLPCPGLRGAEAAARQDALRRLIAALCERHRRAQRQRRRVARVETLSAMLADIVSHLDVDQVLATIVERARDLIGTEVAYLAEVDAATGLVAMRVTLGIADAGYKRGTVKLGAGLAGAVAASRRVTSTGDYLADPRFVHTAETDANVQREGIRGVIMAPLEVGDRVLGVLGVANRRPTEFSDDDLHLMQSLAAGAAIALENARLYAAQTRLVGELRDLNALTSRQHDALKRSVRIHDQLTELVLQGHDVEVIARRLASLIANPVVVLGPFFNLLVAEGIGREEAVRLAERLQIGRQASPLLAADVERLTVERLPIHLAPDPTLELTAPLIVAPILAGPDLLGFVLAIEAQQGFDPLDLQAVEQAATVFALELTRARVVAEVENRIRGDFVHDLVSGAIDRAAIGRRAAGLGHDVTLPQVILAMAPDEPAPNPPAATDAQRIERFQRLERALRLTCQRRSLMAQTSVIGDVVVALVAVTPRLERAGGAGAIVREAQHDLIAFTAPLTVAIWVSRVHRALEELTRAYQEAIQALRAAQRLGCGGGVVGFDQLGVERLLALLPDARELADYVESVLGPLLAYDAAHHTDLVRTLETHLTRGCHQRATAAALGLHVNSVQYRLRRIAEISQVRLDDPEVRLNLQLALRARQVIRGIEPGA